MKLFSSSLLFGMFLNSVSAWAQSPVLTEQEALRLVFERSAIKQYMAGEVALGQADLQAAEKWPNPELSFSRETSDQGNSFEESYVLEQEFDFSGRRGLRVDAANKSLQAAHHRARSWRITMQAKTRQGFYHALYQQQRQAAYDQTQAKLNTVNGVLSRRMREGDVSRYDYQRTRNEHAAIQAETVVIRSDSYTAMQNLRALIGYRLQPFEQLEGELLPGEPQTLSSLLSRLEQQPALRELEQQAASYRLQQRAAEKYLPAVKLGAGVRREESNGLSDEAAIVTVSMPLPIFDTEHDKQTLYRAKAMMAETDYQLARDRAQARLSSLWKQADELRQAAIRFREDAANNAKRLIKLAESYYGAGQTGILELLDAYRGALRSELTALDLEYKARVANIELNKLVGEPEK